jgi:hypothetical protein
MTDFLVDAIDALLIERAIEKIVIERINGRARTASRDFFIGLTSRKTSYDMIRAPELFCTFQTLGRGKKFLFLALGETGQARLYRIVLDGRGRPSLHLLIAQAALRWRRRSRKPSINR